MRRQITFAGALLMLGCGPVPIPEYQKALVVSPGDCTAWHCYTTLEFESGEVGTRSDIPMMVGDTVLVRVSRNHSGGISWEP